MFEQKNMEYAILGSSQDSFLDSLPQILIADDEPYN